MTTPFVAEIPWAEEVRSAQTSERPKSLLNAELWVCDVIQRHVSNIADLLHNPDRGFAQGNFVFYAICLETDRDWKHQLLVIKLSDILRGRGYRVERVVVKYGTYGLEISW